MDLLVPGITAGKVLDLGSFGRWNSELSGDFNHPSDYKEIVTVIIPPEVEKITDSFNSFPALKALILPGGSISIKNSFNNSPNIQTIYSRKPSIEKNLNPYFMNTVHISKSFLNTPIRNIDLSQYGLNNTYQGIYRSFRLQSPYDLAYFRELGRIRLSTNPRGSISIPVNISSIAKIISIDTRNIQDFDISIHQNIDDNLSSIRYIIIERNTTKIGYGSIYGLHHLPNLKYIYLPSNIRINLYETILDCGTNYGGVTLLCDESVELINLDTTTCKVMSCKSLSEAAKIISEDVKKEFEIMQTGLYKGKVVGLNKKYIHPSYIGRLSELSRLEDSLDAGKDGIIHDDERSKIYFGKLHIIQQFGMKISQEDIDRNLYAELGGNEQEILYKTVAAENPFTGEKLLCSKVIFLSNSVQGRIVTVVGAGNTVKEQYLIPDYTWVYYLYYYAKLPIIFGDYIAIEKSFLYHPENIAMVIQGKPIPEYLRKRILDLISNYLNLGGEYEYGECAFYRYDILYDRVFKITLSMAEEVTPLVQSVMSSPLSLDSFNELIKNSDLSHTFRVAKIYYSFNEWMKSNQRLYETLITKTQKILSKGWEKAS